MTKEQLLTKIKIDTDTIAECVVGHLLEKNSDYFFMTMSNDITYFVFKDKDPAIKFALERAFCEEANIKD
jgi:hypothetical protein